MIDRCEQVRDLAPGFVLGALEPDEERLVREHLATCDRPHPEFDELGGVVPYLADSVDVVEPPAELKARILAAAAADLEARGSARPAAAEPPAVEQPAPRAIPAPPPIRVPGPDDVERTGARREAVERLRGGAREPARPSGLPGWAVGLAAVLAIVVLGGGLVAFTNVQRELDVARTYERGVQAVLEVGQRPGGRTVALAPAAGGGPGGLAAVASDGSVALVVRDLAPLSGSEVYEAWLVGAGGTPVPIGDFRPAAGGAAVFTTSSAPVEEVVTLALTREPGPDSTTPTEPILASGEARPPAP
jgi:hypothetical protein